MAEARKTVFVSYAHEDRKWANELVTFMAPWIRDKRVDLWDDSRIQAGDAWQTQIQKAMEEATVAVLLVTKDFLASDFITKHELPVLLKRARQNQVRLAWIAVGSSGVQATQLSEFQAVNDPSRPLETLSRVNETRRWSISPTALQTPPQFVPWLADFISSTRLLNPWRPRWKVELSERTTHSVFKRATNQPKIGFLLPGRTQASPLQTLHTYRRLTANS